MRKLLLILFFVVIAGAIAIKLSGNQHIYRTIAMTIFRGKMGPDIDELKDFPTRSISHPNPEPWPKSNVYGGLNPSQELLNKAIKYKTTALLVIQNDSILYEQYFDGYDATTVSNSFSMAKSFTGLLIGCALKDGFIKSLDEPVGNYVAGYDVAPYDIITIRHLLMMSSGLDFKESYGSLFGWPAKAYYGKDVNATLASPPKINEPGTVYEYKGGDSQLLGMILEKATKMRVANYAAKRLWQKIGAESDAYWSLDVEGGMEKVSCCYYATAHDFARFGKLALQYGRWNEEQVIDSSFIAESMTLAPIVTKEGKPNTQYGYQWWVTNYKDLDVFYARGILGQYIFCIPAKNMIVVRLGHKRAEKKGDELPQDIFDYLDMGLEMAR
ncbi:MAG: beta-lactamase family protein [Bacteroidia bacterium]|nr:beta-lactamase family protein [Bacteroidia bacterium]MCF8447628.1 beta-lactamase family protein [Bacteroidia bacterium]